MSWPTIWLDTVQPYLDQYGLGALFAAVFLEAFGLPLPGETMIVLSGALAGDGKLNVVAVALVAFVAAVAGDNVGYLIGRFGGRPLVLHHGRRVGITHERLARVETLMRRHGSAIVVGARFVALLRQLNGLAAGTASMPWHKFLAANAFGAAIWVGLWTSLSYAFGRNLGLIHAIHAHLNLVAMIVAPLLIVACLAAWWVWRKR